MNVYIEAADIPLRPPAKKRKRNPFNSNPDTRVNVDDEDIGHGDVVFVEGEPFAGEFGALHFVSPVMWWCAMWQRQSYESPWYRPSVSTGNAL